MRTPIFFDKHIDDYSIALLSTTLHAVAFAPTLWLETCIKDPVLLDPALIFRGNYLLLEQIKQLFKSSDFVFGDSLCEMLISKTPILKDLPDLLAAMGSD